MTSPGEDGQADGAKHQVQRLGGQAARRAERGRGEQHREGLPGDRHRRPGNGDRYLCRQRGQRGAEQDRGPASGQRRGQRLRQDGTAGGQGKDSRQHNHHL